jgi:hypothetical protein
VDDVDAKIDIDNSADAELFNVTAIDSEDTCLGEAVPFAAWDE